MNLLGPWRRWRARRQLDALLIEAVLKPDEADRVATIDRVNALLHELERKGAVSAHTRLRMGQEWLTRYTRLRMPALWRAGDAREVEKWAEFIREAG